MNTEEKCWYILDTRQVVGNCAYWWRPDGQGYTCNINDAGLYTRKAAFSRRVSDVPVHRDVAQANAVTHVRVEGLWRHEKTCERLTAAQDAKIETLRRGNELSASELSDALETNPFVADDAEDDHDVTVLRDEIVTAAKVHTCHDCGSKLCKGLIHRCRVETSVDRLASFRWCHDCTRSHVGYPYGEQRHSQR